MPAMRSTFVPTSPTSPKEPPPPSRLWRRTGGILETWRRLYVVEVRGWIKIKFSKEEFDLLKNCKFYIYAENWESEDIEFKDDTLYFNEIPFLIGMKWKLGVRF